jgi:serine/threonine-protein kinase HipA
LLIRRYDRVKNSKGLITRIHQEDFCQALGLMPEMKYQGIDGGPGIAVCMDLINRNSSQPAKDILKFVNAIIFNYLIGNSDAHGKNFSFLYKKNLVSLAPLYDLVCTATHKQLDQKMAMKIGRVSDPSYLLLRNWYSLFSDNQSAKSLLNKTLKDSAATLPTTAYLLKEDLEKHGISSPIFDKIVD